MPRGAKIMYHVCKSTAWFFSLYLDSPRRADVYDLQEEEKKAQNIHIPSTFEAKKIWALGWGEHVCVVGLLPMPLELWSSN